MESVHSEHESIDEVIVKPRTVSLKLKLFGECPGDFYFFALFHDEIILNCKWCDGLELETENLPLNLKEPSSADLVAQQPLLLILRSKTKKGFDNKIGATVDLFPLVLGESDIYTQVHLVYIENGEYSGCSVEVAAHAGAGFESRIPLVITMISAHCLPKAKEGTVYVSAIGFNDSTNMVPVNFGTSLCNVYVASQKVLWATASTHGLAASTGSSVPGDDFYVPQNFDTDDTDKCNSAYWHSMNRILADSEELREQLQSPLLIQVAGLPKTGKGDIVRGHYMALLDAKILLLPGVQGATFTTKLWFYKESDIPDNLHPVLNLPPSSARGSARHSDFVLDEYGHSAYVKIRLEVTEPIIPKVDIMAYYEVIGQVLNESRLQVVDEPPVETPPDDPCVDVRRLQKEGGALAVHKELTSIATIGYIPMNQSMKRTAANQLLTSIKSLLTAFPPGECSHIEWQDTVTAHHAACRRAVTASLNSQPTIRDPQVKMVDMKTQVKEDTHAYDVPISYTLQQTTTLLRKALHCLDTGEKSEARNNLLEALKAPLKNRFILWAYGAQEFDRGNDYLDKTTAAFHVAIASDDLDSLTNTIGWAALHAVSHYSEQYEKAFIAALNMRRFHKLKGDWKGFLKKWKNTSGVEETFWMPQVISMQNPLIIAAAFFLCLRGYKLCERLLQCVYDGCSFRGTQDIPRQNNTPDVNYIKAASLLLRRQFEEALKVTDEGVTHFGPTPNLLQIRTSCLFCIGGWNRECEKALGNAERVGAQVNPELLLQAAIGDMSSNPSTALQRAARAHKILPCTRSALTIGRIFDKMNNREFAERWAAAAVKLDPMNADGWGFLALLAIHDGEFDKARVMLRTAEQAGQLCPDIKAYLEELMTFLPVEDLPDSLVRDLCLCVNY